MTNNESVFSLATTHSEAVRDHLTGTVLISYQEGVITSITVSSTKTFSAADAKPPRVEQR